MVSRLKIYIWENYILQLLIAIDQFIKVFLWGGNPDITISDYCGRHYPYLAKIIDKIFFWQKQHCLSSYEKDEQEYRKGYYWLFWLFLLSISILYI